MPLKLPPYQFDASLKEYPLNRTGWDAFIIDLFKQTRSPLEPQNKLEIYESLGVALRIAGRLDEAESYLQKALDLSENTSNKIQNLIRLAHVYQWKKEFTKSQNLFNQTRTLINENDISENLKASYHQNLGKFYFDQAYMGLAVTEFELALNIRRSIKAPQDQIESTLLALNESKKRCPYLVKDIIIRRAQIADAESVHWAHMKSINEICVQDHSAEEIRVWGGRPFDPATRLPGIKDQFYLVIESAGRIEGFCQLKTSFNENVKSAHIFGFYITPPILNKGVGHALIQLVFEYAQVENIQLITLKSTITAFDFYKKYGFIPTGELTGSAREGVQVRGYPMQKVFG
jgi:tetratricopeptide (TPR) repeat protein